MIQEASWRRPDRTFPERVYDVLRDLLKGNAAMLAAIDPRRLRVGTHHRLWLVVSAVMAFLLAVLWAKPID